jgi:hypothetical protein
MRRLAAILVLGVLAGGAAAQPAPSRHCPRYAENWAEALRRFGAGGLGADFLARHGEFLASGCRSRVAVCPATPAEQRMADVMTILAMNAGAASSFVPFRCG